MLKKMVPSKKALLGWEMGGGLGHVHCLMRMAKALEARGFEPVLALKQPELLGGQTPWPVVRAPVFDGVAPSGFVATTFADVLAVSGYAGCESLLPLVDGWRAILREVRPSVVVADYSPTLCLAARGEYPVVATGTGFALPPSQNGLFPRMSEHGRSPVSQERIFATIQQVQRQRGRSALKSLASLLETDARFVTTLPEVDTYAGLRTTPAVGPVDPLPAPSRSTKKAFFAYLSMEMPGCEAVLEALAKAGFSGRAFVRGADATLRERMGRLGLEVCERPLSPEQIVAESAVIVHHGSGIADLALAAGRPQFVFPAHLEHFLTARRLCGLGVAHLLSGTYPASDVTEGLRELMQDTKFSRRAAAVAADIHSRGPWNALGKIVSSCEQLSVNPIGKSIGSSIGSSVG
jgi:hypothetical protein